MIWWIVNELCYRQPLGDRDKEQYRIVPLKVIFWVSSRVSISNAVSTSEFSNASGQKGTVGSILETAITLAPGEKFSFDLAFLGMNESLTMTSPCFT